LLNFRCKSGLGNWTQIGQSFWIEARLWPHYPYIHMSVDYTIYIYEVCWECRRKFHEVEYNQMIYKLYGKKYNKPQRSVWIQLQSRGLWQAYDKSAARVAQSGSELLLGGSVAQWLSCSVGLEWLRVGPVCGPLSPHPPLSSVATIWRLQRHLRLVFVSGDICFIFHTFIYDYF